jgi:hypothetical protein
MVAGYPTGCGPGYCVCQWTICQCQSYRADGNLIYYSTNEVIEVQGRPKRLPDPQAYLDLPVPRGSKQSHLRAQPPKGRPSIQALAMRIR